MHRRAPIFEITILTAVAFTFALVGCGPTTDRPNAEGDAGEMRLVVDISERTLYVYHGGQVQATHPVAVGQPQYPTPTGSYSIHQIDWNPDWTPPNSDWAAGETYKAPGEAGNPMGRVRMIFRPPYTIHGTDALGSLGNAASHGSIRLANSVIIGLARQVMAHGGAAKSDGWYQQVIGDPTDMRQVALPNPVPVQVRP